MLKRSIQIAVGMALWAGLTACATDRQVKEARSVPPLRMPPGVSSVAFKSDYPLPDRHYPVSDKNVNITPPV
jgi:uncharacterized lipoprotein